MEEPDDQTASLSKGPQECYEIVCEPCSESELVKADGYCVECKEFMCKQCIKFSKRMKRLKHHHILGPEEMPKTKHVCKDHKVADCMDCTNRSCADIMRVEEASSDTSADTELAEFDRKLKAVAEGFRNMLHIAEKSYLEVDDQKKKLLQDIRQYKETIIKTLENLSSKIKTQLNSIIIDNQTKIDQLIKRCKALQEDVEITSDEFDSLRENNQRTKEFNLMNQSQLQLAEWEKDWNDMVANSKPNHYSFCPDLNLRRAMQEVSEFGQLVGKVDAEQCGVCKTMTVKIHIHKLGCGHGICDVCTNGSDGKDHTSSTCGKVPCKRCSISTLECGHDFCLSCRKQQAEKEVPCDVCRLITGNQPPGTFKVRTEKEFDKTIQVLEFYFRGGKQEPFHPCPGKPYGECTLICRLPDWGDGKKVCQMLKTAFDRKLVCKLEQDKIVPNIELYQGTVRNKKVYTGDYRSYISRVMKRLQGLGITA